MAREVLARLDIGYSATLFWYSATNFRGSPTPRIDQLANEGIRFNNFPANGTLIVPDRTDWRS